MKEESLGCLEGLQHTMEGGWQFKWDSKTLIECKGGYISAKAQFRELPEDANLPQFRIHQSSTRVWP